MVPALDPALLDEVTAEEDEEMAEGVAVVMAAAVVKAVEMDEDVVEEVQVIGR